MGSYAPYHDERCVDNPYGLNDSSEQLIHLPSLAVQQRSQSPLQNDRERGSNVILPPLRVVIPHQFSPPSTPHHGISSSPSGHNAQSQRISPESHFGQKRMKLDSLMTSPSSSAISDRARSYQTQQDYLPAAYGESNAGRRSQRERSVSELYSRRPPARPPLYSDRSATYDPTASNYSPYHGEKIDGMSSSWNAQQAHTLPSLSALNRATTSFPGGDREMFRSTARPGTFETANGVRMTTASSNGVDRRWNRRSNSRDYSFHDRSHGFGTMVPSGAELTDAAAPPPYSWDINESAENQMNRKRRGNLPKAATTMFKKWFDEHRDSPYPTEEEKACFCKETGLTMNQVGNWFINARRRQPNRGLRDGPGSFQDD